MDVSSIRKYLRPYKIYGRGSTSVTYAFAAAVVGWEPYDPAKITAALKLLGQEPCDLSCVYCDAKADRWDHLLPVVKDGRQFGRGHRICNLVPCCSLCNGAKGNKDFAEWLPNWAPDWEARLQKLRVYLHQDGSALLPKAEPAETETALAAYWRIRDLIFDLMHHADTAAARIHSLRDEAADSRKCAPDPLPDTSPPQVLEGMPALEVSTPFVAGVFPRPPRPPQPGHRCAGYGAAGPRLARRCDTGRDPPPNAMGEDDKGVSRLVSEQNEEVAAANPPEWFSRQSGRRCRSRAALSG